MINANVLCYFSFIIILKNKLLFLISNFYKNKNLNLFFESGFM